MATVHFSINCNITLHTFLFRCVCLCVCVCVCMWGFVFLYDALCGSFGGWNCALRVYRIYLG